MWGLVLACFAAVENYAGAIAIRFFLGVFESAVTPGFALFTSQWYTKKEQGTRTSIWFSFNGFAQVRKREFGYLFFNPYLVYSILYRVVQYRVYVIDFKQIFGGLVAYGIAVGCRKTGTIMEPWKIVFLVTGLLTSCIGIIFLWAVPDNQLNCRWLTKEERVLAIERIRINGQGVGNKHFKFYQLKEALLDPLAWAFFFYALIADIPNGAYALLEG
jgi:ACS family allantoate permease-like MFS transporter